VSPFFSFIVPVYNTEKYLGTCINSLLAQSFKDFEIIIVDDGSIDGCHQICDLYADKNDFIKVIHKKNEGLGKARNSGLELAKGQYISFIDSDDWISENMAEIIYQHLSSCKIEMIEFGLIHTDVENKNTGLKLPRIREGIYEKDEIIHIVLPNFIADNGERISNSVCNHVYLRRLIEAHQIRFFSEREIYTEDFLFNLQYVLHIEELKVIKDIFYYYRFTIGSLTKSYRTNYLNIVGRRDATVLEILEKAGLAAEYRQYVEEKFIRISPSFIFNALLSKNQRSGRGIIDEIRNILNDPLITKAFVNIDFKKLPWKKWFIYYLMKIRKAKLLYFFLKLYNNTLAVFTISHKG
jgi:glycosyltransferase involved in cell wall biosynthesis